MVSRAKGDKAEAKALKFLEQNGFYILDQNYYTRFGEIDIIAKKEEVLHFIEVKSALEYAQAVANITPAKLLKIIKTSHVYMKKEGYEDAFVYDAVIITPEKLEFLENITL